MAEVKIIITDQEDGLTSVEVESDPPFNLNEGVTDAQFIALKLLDNEIAEAGEVHDFQADGKSLL